MAKPSVSEVVGDLFSQYAPAIYRYCHAQLPREEAEDVTSEVFIVAFHKAGGIPEEAVKAWLYSVARRLIATHLRSAKRRGALAYRIGLNLGAGWDQMDVVGAVTDADLAMRAIAKLSQRDREVLWLSATEDLNLTELGKALGIGTKGAGMRLARARQRLGEALQLLEEQDSTTRGAEGVVLS